MNSAIEDLLALRLHTVDQMTHLKAELSSIDKAITHLALPAWTDKLRLSGKEHGNLKLVVDGVSVQGEVRKTVKWDSDKLKTIAAKCSGEDAAIIFSVTLSVSEEQVAMLEEFEHPALGEILLARSVTLSAFSAKPATK